MPLIRIAHLTDLHFRAPWSNGSWMQNWMSKRVFARFRLELMGRAVAFSNDTARRAVLKVNELRPDIVLCSGDLTSTSFAAEFEMAKEALSPLFDSIPSMVIPGNHDVYTYRDVGAFERHFSRWLHPHPNDQKLQIMRTNHDVLIAGMNVCRPSILDSSGRADQSTLKALRRFLNTNEAIEAARMHRLLLTLHYPLLNPKGEPYHESDWKHSLQESGAELLHLLRHKVKARPTFIAHGHIHEAYNCSLKADANGAEIPILNAGSAGYSFLSNSRRARFNIYTIDSGKSGSCTIAIQPYGENTHGEFDPLRPTVVQLDSPYL